VREGEKPLTWFMELNSMGGEEEVAEDMAKAIDRGRRP
jgi:hypothetical protein